MILYGYRTRNKVLGQVEQTCTKCQKATMHTVIRTRRWMTLFFVSVFPFTKSSTARCNICGLQTKVDNKQADAWFPKQPQIQPQGSN